METIKKQEACGLVFSDMNLSILCGPFLNQNGWNKQHPNPCIATGLDRITIRGGGTGSESDIRITFTIKETKRNFPIGTAWKQTFIPLSFLYLLWKTNLSLRPL